MKRLIVTTIVEPNDESLIYENLIDAFKLSQAEIYSLDRGFEISVAESDMTDGRVITKVKIEVTK